MFRQFFLILLIFSLSACVSTPREPSYQPSSSSLPMGQKSFDEYVSQTRQWLEQNRLFMTSNTNIELAANTPFEMLPRDLSRPKKGILLVHGLADSPYSFVDIAPVLASWGFHVRTILLQGHGSRPADLIDADADNWRELLEQQVKLFKQDVDELYLGGFSTGGNLVSSYAMGDDQIKGLVLFSPGFKSKMDLDRFSGLAPVFSDWLYAPSLKGETNYVRYMVSPSNGFAQFYDTSANILFRLKKRTFDKPVFMVVSEADSVIDVRKVLKLFSERFRHQDSRLIWYGEPPQTTDTRVLIYPGKVPKYNISNFSHMSVLFRPDNSYYGINGTERICDNGQVDNKLYSQCLNGGEIWYSAWGLVEKGKHHARLTFNPYFEQMIEVIKGVLVGF